MSLVSMFLKGGSDSNVVLAELRERQQSSKHATGRWVDRHGQVLAGHKSGRERCGQGLGIGTVPCARAWAGD
jgi:hypothetical protein